ncbi:Short repeat-containing protein of unknown function [Amycolatopsis marina]|uniref:Methyl-accepting transducer domain-containing protein n=1 Tax=Amycolatopsis marina TaxID=490629 RepID=A0A1I0XMG4_9PSEU|nr:ALF repeat-containing protein [Amycolatopsis marina]SFB02084.1 Short repeat-containing protein of unknown function [Amycolatopsis marina]
MGEAACAAGDAARAAISAGSNAAAAGQAAYEAGSHAAAAGAQADRARAAAARAERAAARATRAANAADALAREAERAANEAHAAANRAANHAEAAAQAADDAAKHAGDADRAADAAAAHAAAAKEAAQEATAAAAQAQKVEQAARAAEAERLATQTEEAVEAAKELRTEYDNLKSDIAWDTEEAARRDEEARRLLAEACEPGTPETTVVAKGRRVAMRILTTGGPWSQGAAETALIGTEAQVVQFVRTELTLATEQDDHARVAHIAATGTPEALADAAEAALSGTPEQIRTFLRTQNYEGREHDDRIAILQLLNDAGPAVRDAANAALDGTTADQREFLRTGQYVAREHDERIAVLQALSSGGPEVKAAAQIALEGPPELLSEFLRVEKHRAIQRDQAAASHVATVQRYVAQAAQSAATANENAAVAAQNAAIARKAADEAARHAERARQSANEAQGYANQARSSAQQAQEYANQAAESARQARTAAATAREDARQAANSATHAARSAASARAFAAQAADAAAQARASAEAAGKDAAEAAKAVSEAVEIFLRLHREEEAQRRLDESNGKPLRSVVRQYDNGTRALFVDGECFVNGVAIPFQGVGLPECERLARNFDSWLAGDGSYYSQSGPANEHDLPALYLRAYCETAPEDCSTELRGQLAQVPGLVVAVQELGGEGALFRTLLRRANKLLKGGVTSINPLLPGRSGSALQGWSSRTFQVSSAKISLTKERMTHILERHHPSYWNGSWKSQQSFFNGKVTVKEVEDVISQSINQHSKKIIDAGVDGDLSRLVSTVNGREYIMSISRGKIVQFYPL